MNDIHAKEWNKNRRKQSLADEGTFTFHHSFSFDSTQSIILHNDINVIHVLPEAIV